jgi:phosphatidylethanolamine N-methyltransferase
MATADPGAELRARKPYLQDLNDDTDEETAQERVMRLNMEEQKASNGKPRRAFGRTPDGTGKTRRRAAPLTKAVFVVPQTHDMVSQLLSPSQPKNASDLFVLAILALHILAPIWLPAGWRSLVMGVLFIFWRSSYNAGIGYLLHMQSIDRRLVHWAKKLHIFQDPASGKNPHPRLYAAMKRELETKIPNDYRTEAAPIEYNTWLVFRRVVDLILMCDFVSYCMFAITCTSIPAGEPVVLTVGRWLAGSALIFFNLWVKLDAHRIVKDYAWYWGDFFFLIDQDLTFDGVFEMAPHPMYSIGYAGYYGISLMSASYKVLFISIVAHAAQFLFLISVESPHIEKTYNTPARKNKPQRVGNGTPDDQLDDQSDIQPSTLHKILGIQNTDLHRVVDLAIYLLHLQTTLLVAWAPSTPVFQFYFFLNALFWRLWFVLGIGFILNRQSAKKSWTRHFIKYGDDAQEAFRQWKGVYHLSNHLCYGSFGAVAWKFYHFPTDWSYGTTLLRHVVGFALLGLHIWTVASIRESLGEFGWFYGDFFFDRAPKLTYGGIYRFLNNPERFLGLAGLWGFAIITWSRSIFALALISHLLTLFFIQFVERPHMQKLYGESLRQESGLSKGYRRSLPKPIRELQGTVDRRIEQTADYIDELIEALRGKLNIVPTSILYDASNMLKQYPARIISRSTEALEGRDAGQYSLSVQGTPTSGLAELDRRSGRESESGRLPPARRSNYKPLIFEYGSTIKVRWKAPLNHGKKDWIGLYMISDNVDREVTQLSSRGRWVATTPGQFDSLRADQGIIASDTLAKSGDESHYEGDVIFEGDKLWWTTGVFEFRYHSDGKHNVMAISNPFEIRISRFDEDGAELDSEGTLRAAVERALLPVVRNCLDRDPSVAPDAVDEPFGTAVERDEKYGKRVVFAVHQMFGIEFAPHVVMVDGMVKSLAARICTAKKALVSDLSGPGSC